MQCIKSMLDAIIAVTFSVVDSNVSFPSFAQSTKSEQCDMLSTKHACDGSRCLFGALVRCRPLARLASIRCHGWCQFHIPQIPSWPLAAVHHRQCEPSASRIQWNDRPQTHTKTCVCKDCMQKNNIDISNRLHIAVSFDFVHFERNEQNEGACIPKTCSILLKGIALNRSKVVWNRCADKLLAK